MDIKEIKAIVDLMKRSSLTEFQIEEKDLKLKICRKSEENPTVYHTATPPPFPVQAPAQAPAPAAAATAADGDGVVRQEEGNLIKSPMVGTFYAAPSPESPPFVSVGDTVANDSVVCIVEAMKVMNEITADTKGKIVEILVENGENVEYGQALFRVK